MSKKKPGRPKRLGVKPINVRLSEDRHERVYALAEQKKWTIRVALESIIDYFFANGGDKK